MKFSPFQNLYQHIKKSDSLLFQTLDRISDNLKALFTISSTTVTTGSALTPGTIPEAATATTLVNSPMVDDGTLNINFTTRNILLANANAIRWLDSGGVPRTTLILNGPAPDVLRIRNTQGGTGGKIQFENNAINMVLDTSGNLDLIGKFTKYNNLATVGYGVTVPVGLVSTGLLSVAIGTTLIYNYGSPTPAGFYRVSYYVMTAVAGTGNVQVSVAWTDSVGAKATLIATNLTAGNFAQNTIFIPHVGGTDITYQVLYSATGSYIFRIIIEKLS